MKKRFFFFFFIAGIVLLNSCQKEVSFENDGTLSAGSLQSDSTGDCLPKTVAGSYVEGTALNGDSSYIEVQVNVTQAGSYTINTETVNGIYFSVSGAFTTTGINTVKMKGNGTPLAAGIYNFIVAYDSTECTIAVTTLPPGSGGPAAFTLSGDPGTCMNFVPTGTYTAATPLTATNTVTINVDVTTIGTYNVSTTESNGMTFTGAGTFSAMGPQSIILTGTGTPTAAGTTNIPVKADNSTCSFTIDVLDASVLGDYFPRSANSNWSYEFGGDPNDSLYVRATSATSTISGNVYNIFEWTDSASTFAEYGKFRKAGGNYYSYADMGEYFPFFDNSINMEYIFLKDDVPVNTSWQTATINGTTSGSAVPLRIVFTIVEKDVTVAIGTSSFDSTIVVTEKYEVFTGANWVDVTDIMGYYKIYYAKNIGMIKQDLYYEDGNYDPPLYYKGDIRRYQVF
jgi:hypothetical protein